MRRAIKAVVYGFFGTLLSGALILGPLIFVIEARAAGQRTQAVESAHAELSDLIDAGTILAVAFPDEAEWPEAQRREPMRRATCRDKDLELMVKEVRARAALCITEDGASRRMFVVGLAWDEAAPIRRALSGLRRLQDVAGFGWMVPEQMGVIVHQEFWP